MLAEPRQEVGVQLVERHRHRRPSVLADPARANTARTPGSDERTTRVEIGRLVERHLPRVARDERIRPDLSERPASSSAVRRRAARRRQGAAFGGSPAIRALSTHSRSRCSMGSARAGPRDGPASAHQARAQGVHSRRESGARALDRACTHRDSGAHSALRPGGLDDERCRRLERHDRSDRGSRLVASPMCNATGALFQLAL